MANLAGKTYEVFTAEGERWLIESSHPSRSAALEQAEVLLGSGKHDGVRVVSESERTGENEVIFEERVDRDKAITIVAIDDAPPCKDIADFYRFPARRTASRLLRRHLDDQGVTALELLYKPGHLMMFERNDKLFPPGVQRIAAIQAKAAGTKAADRVEEIYEAFGQIKERAKTWADEQKYPALLDAKGLNALVAGAGQWEKGDQREFVIRGALASHLGARGDWNGKLQLLVALVRENPTPEAVAYVDEAAAEILDGAEAVMEVLGGQADAASANRVLIHLSAGRSHPPKNPISCIVELNEMVARLDLPLTRGVLLERVQSQIGGVRPLTREGHEAESDAFAGLVRELSADDGLMGGPGMADALLRRARITLSDGETDLTVEQGIDHLLDVMGNRAVRLGFLLDLAASPTGVKENALVMQALDRIAKQLSFLASLIPDTSSPEVVAQVVAGLKGRLERDGLDKEWRQRMAATLDDLVARAQGGGKAAPKGAKKRFSVDIGSGKMADPTGERKSIKAGDIVFEEGEMGEVAFLIVSGGVEIFRTAGNSERVLATLGRGEIIGEMSLIDSQPRVASARALEDTEISIISRRSLQQRLDRLEEDDKVLRRLIAVLVTRIRGQAQSPE